MAFGLFKKKAAADLILKNGRIITQNADMPEAEAVACQDGKIIAAGDLSSIEALINGNTEIIDLDGKYAVPGFVSLWQAPSLKVFHGKYLDLNGCPNKDELLILIKGWADSHEEAEVIFGFGYNESIFDEELQNDGKAAAEFLDSACSEKPVVLLCENNISCIFNSQAEEIITQTAEEEMVRYITTPYILNLFVPFDFEELEQSVSTQLTENIERGITSSMSLGAPDYFEALYQDALISLYNEGLLHQRFFSSYFLNRPLLPKGLLHRLMQMKTNCNEMNGFINANLLLIELNQKNCPMDFSQQSLNTISEEAADKNFDIYFRAQEQADLKKAYLAAEHVRGKGYKDMIAIESTCSLPEEIKKELMWHDSIYGISDEFKEHAWQNAPFIAGISDTAGSIEPGKLADIAVFENNPYENAELGLPSEKAVITVFNGKVIYQRSSCN